jgi:hypothetical protein
MKSSDTKCCDSLAFLGSFVMAAAEQPPVEAVANGLALSVVRSWLPAPADGDDDGVDDWGDQPTVDEAPRPARRAHTRLPHAAPTRVEAA